MRNAKEYFEEFRNDGYEYVCEQIKIDAIEELQETLEDMDSYDLFEIINSLNDDVLRMEDLDDEYEYMTVTEIINNLGWVDTSCEYFNKDREKCSDDLFEVSDTDVECVARRVWEGSFDYNSIELDNIVHNAEYIKCEVKKMFEVYTKAEELFRLAMEKDSSEVIALLWNMNN